MRSSAVVNALLTNALMGVLFYGINAFAEVTKDDQAKQTGVTILIAITFAGLFAFVWKWNTIRTWTFYLVVIPLLLASSFDVLLIIDTWLMPNGTVLQAINLMAIYKMSQGRSARSLLLVTAMSIAFLLFK
ncbi:unnamed protein product, partial [Allacma fusca]